jgi:folate-binding Fe-S cluster repair protein YgfZ
MSDLLKTKKPQEPPQIHALKAYVLEHHNQVIQCSMSNSGYSISVPNASLASTLHMETPKIIKECNLDKKLFIRIAHF